MEQGIGESGNQGISEFRKAVKPSLIAVKQHSPESRSGISLLKREQGIHMSRSAIYRPRVQNGPVANRPAVSRSVPRNDGKAAKRARSRKREGAVVSEGATVLYAVIASDSSFRLVSSSR